MPSGGVNHATLLQSGLQTLKETVKSDKSVLSLEDGDKRTLIHVAAYQGELEALQWLLKVATNADLKRKDKNGSTPLHIAIQRGHLAEAEALLARGCSPNSEDRNLASPFFCYCRYVCSPCPFPW